MSYLTNYEVTINGKCISEVAGIGIKSNPQDCALYINIILRHIPCSNFGRVFKIVCKDITAIEFNEIKDTILAEAKKSTPYQDEYLNIDKILDDYATNKGKNVKFQIIEIKKT